MTSAGAQKWLSDAVCQLSTMRPSYREFKNCEYKNVVRNFGERI